MGAGKSRALCAPDRRRAVRGNGDEKPRLTSAHTPPASSILAAGRAPSSAPGGRTSTLPTCSRQSPEDLQRATPSTALATAASPRRRLSTQAPRRRETTRTVGHQNPGALYGPGGLPADRNTAIFETRRISDLETLGNHEP